ncbi:hypothetical protein [Phenylobacterium sp.]|jgi:hypothetical protein|uniref:hypothetical protein n=1 Tax=Phenylobacterium sp. TaxID=1871053 RepID=UPI002F40DAE2
MTTLNKLLATGTLIATVAGGALAVSAVPASADVVCNRYNECWRVNQRYTTYPPHLGVTFHDDAWREQNKHAHYHWRKDRDDDRGYYSHGSWHSFSK